MDKEKFEELKGRAVDITPEEFSELRDQLTPAQQNELVLAIIKAHGSIIFDSAMKDMEARKNPRIERYIGRH